MRHHQKPIQLAIINLLLFSIFMQAEPQFNLKEEKRKLSNKVFKHYDLNHDKNLSFDEFCNFSKEMKEKEEISRVESTIQTCDKDGNGKIEFSEVPTEKEIQEAYKKDYPTINTMCYMDEMEFHSINKDDDEVITKEEILLSFKQSDLEIWGHNFNQMETRDKLKEFKDRLNTCDTNKDREISLIEATNSICYMSSEEFLEYASDPKKTFHIDEVTHAPNENQLALEHRFKRCDSNGDTKLDLLEASSIFCNMSSDEFMKIDIDNNNYIEKNELKNIYKDEAMQVTKLSSKVMKEMPPLVQINFAINQCDENNNKKLSREEAENCELPMKTFEKFDYDKSNSIEENDIEMIQKRQEFNIIDINSNHKLDENEFEECMNNRYREF